MDRRTALKTLSLGLVSTLIGDRLVGMESLLNAELSRNDFGRHFKWGVATSAYQIEGAWDSDGKGMSIWDTFSHKDGNIKTSQTADKACDFYHRYPSDIKIVKDLNFDAFRFSLSWPRIMPTGRTAINQKGIDFYQKVIDECLKQGVEPWITLYHWDLPQALEDRGGWKNRDVVDEFSEYALICAKAFGDRVKHWMVLNEPFAFTALGYFLGMHAPGKLGLKNFLPTVHHATLCQSAGGRILRENVRDGKIGTTQTITIVDPYEEIDDDISAARRADAFLNRIFIEPAVGLGYPVADLPALSRIEKSMQPGDAERMKFDFDFMGVQTYTRIKVKHAGIVPVIHALPVSPKKRKVKATEMKWEVCPEGIYRALKFYDKYPLKEIYITENGAAFKDVLADGKVHDTDRINYFRDYLEQVLRAKKEGVNVKGYFVWSLLDNFEWAEGYRPRFGLVYVDYKSQKRFVKDSGFWFRDFLQ